MSERVVVLVDMDCFYVQVEQRYDAKLVGKPCAVVQYNGWRGGGIIAVNYEARDCGVTRHIRGDEALKICPTIHLVRVPEVRGKADLSKYRDAGKEVIDVLCQFSKNVERASVDEAYIDLTEEVNTRLNINSQKFPEKLAIENLPNTYVVSGQMQKGSSKCEKTRLENLNSWLMDVNEDVELTNMFDKKLYVAAVIAEEMRKAVFEKTGFRCSAGIAHNKMLAKLSCGINKPNCQTIMPQSAVLEYFETLDLRKIRNLGGKLGETLQSIGCQTVGQLFKMSEADLDKHFGSKTGKWLYDIARGIDVEPVVTRYLPKSIGCSKNFPGRKALTTKEEVKHWVQQLAAEVAERLKIDKETNKRTAKSLVVHVTIASDASGSISRTCQLVSYEAHRIANDAYSLLEKINSSSQDGKWSPAIVSMGASATKFQDGSGMKTMAEFLNAMAIKSADKNKSNFPECEHSQSINDSGHDREAFEQPTQKKIDTSSIASFFLRNANEPSSSQLTPVNVSKESNYLRWEDVDYEVLNDLPQDIRKEVECEMEASQIEQENNSSQCCEQWSATETCDRCGERVSRRDMPEHKDHHMAMDLQKEFNSSSNVNSSPKVINDKCQGRKRHKTKGKSLQDSKKARPITAFFVPDSS